MSRTLAEPVPVRRLNEAPGKDICVLGSGCPGSLIRDDLVGEYVLLIHPLLLGSGRRMFPGAARPRCGWWSPYHDTGVLAATCRPGSAVAGRRECLMKQYLLSIYVPDGDPPPPEELEPVFRELAALEAEMKAAGAWVFSGALHVPSTATVLRNAGGEVVVTDGPWVEGKEFLGGFTIVRASDLDAALAWGSRLATVLGGLAVEVRPFQDDAGE